MNRLVLSTCAACGSPRALFPLALLTGVVGCFPGRELPWLCSEPNRLSPRDKGEQAPGHLCNGDKEVAEKFLAESCSRLPVAPGATLPPGVPHA